MKNVIIVVFVSLVSMTACNAPRTMSAIQPKAGSIELPASGELRVWRNISHPSFRVSLINHAATQSCELYTVTSNGNEKWVRPSLLANTTLEITIPYDGHLFIKNFNNNQLSIYYKIHD